MGKFLLYSLAMMTSFVLGSLMAQRTVSPPAPPIIINNYPQRTQNVASEKSSLDKPYPIWRRWGNRLLDYYYPRSFVGNLVIGLHSPTMRRVFAEYLQQGWTEVKRSTATISPEAAAKLETDLEPVASQTLQKIQSQLNTTDPSD